MRVLGPDSEGYVENDGVKIHYEVTGSDGPTLLLLPTWTIVHKRFWKALSVTFTLVMISVPAMRAARLQVTDALAGR